MSEHVVAPSFGRKVDEVTGRIYDVPNKPMRKVHKALIKALWRTETEGFSVFASGRGALPGMSPLANAQEHIGGRYFFIMDLRRAYPSVSMDRLANVFDAKVIGASARATLEAFVREHLPESAQDSLSQLSSGSGDPFRLFLERYCKGHQGGLATGANASPLLFNMYCARTIDPKLRDLCRKAKIQYTRYADDLTFSSSDEQPSRSFRDCVHEIVKNAGFTIHHGKCERASTERRPVCVTGYHIRGGKLELTPEFLRKADLILKNKRYRSNPSHVRGVVARLFEIHPNEATKRVLYLQKICRERLARYIPMDYTQFYRFVRKFPRRIPEELLDAVHAQVPVSAEVSRLVKLRKRGKEKVGLCPFHNEKTPSFTVSDEKGFYHCFGCGAHGDVIRFVMETTGLDFREAVAKLVIKHGINARLYGMLEQASTPREARTNEPSPYTLADPGEIQRLATEELPEELPRRLLDGIRDHIPVSAEVSRSVKLTRRGREWVGFCPFFEQETPSFTADDGRGFYHCFGCGAHGNVISFVMFSRELEFREALAKLIIEHEINWRELVG